MVSCKEKLAGLSVDRMHVPPQSSEHRFDEDFRSTCLDTCMSRYERASKLLECWHPFIVTEESLHGKESILCGD